MSENWLDELQREAGYWCMSNFGATPIWQPALGIAEEAGELCHAVLKSAQGVRGTKAEHDAKARDAIGDIAIFLIDFCNHYGWSLKDVIQETWDEVAKRDWKLDRAKNSLDELTKDAQDLGMYGDKE